MSSQVTSTTTKEASIRTRVNITQSAKGEYRLAEFTVEVSDADNPVALTQEVIDQLTNEVNQTVAQLNAQNDQTKRFTS